MSVMMSLTAVKGSGYISSHVHRAYSDRSMCRQKKPKKKNLQTYFKHYCPQKVTKCTRYLKCRGNTVYLLSNNLKAQYAVNVQKIYWRYKYCVNYKY